MYIPDEVIRMQMEQHQTNMALYLPHTQRQG